jgi:serine O-acetyltransferase
VSIPDLKAVEKLIGSIFDLLFPVGDDLKTDKEIEADESLQFLLESILESLVKNKGLVTKKFLEKLPSTRKRLIKDAEFILNSDPAARDIVEVVSIYPGFYAIYCFRMAHCLGKMNVPLLPRIITEHAHSKTGIDIHPLASIGCPFSIDHGTGIVIGETTKIGHKVKMYQGVTLGALSVSKNKAAKKRHPTIQDNVILYSGCTILGGETVVGRNSIIGGNVFLTDSVPPFSVVYHKNEVIVRDHSKFNEPVNFVI